MITVIIIVIVIVVVIVVRARGSSSSASGLLDARPAQSTSEKGVYACLYIYIERERHYIIGIAKVCV